MLMLKNVETFVDSSFGGKPRQLCSFSHRRGGRAVETTRYVLKKAASGLLTTVLSFCLTFFLIRAAPGSPVKALSGSENPNLATAAYLTEKYGLDQPLTTQLFRYLKQAAQGDLGYSYLSRRPVSQLIGEKIGPTLLLTLTAVVFSLFLGSLLGFYAARNPETLFSRWMQRFSYLFDSLPGFWLGLILILVFASWLKLVPTAGMTDLRQQYVGFRHGLDVARHMALPVLTLVIVQSPLYFRVARSSAAKALKEDYVKILRAAGLAERTIFYRFVLRNAAIPLATVLSSDLAFALAGVSLVETVFAWPGMGRMLMEAVLRRDYPLLTGIYLVLSLSICVAMIGADLLYATLDPRIRF